MQPTRLVIVADGHDLTKIINVLESIGIKPSQVHVSVDQCSDILIDRGVAFDIPKGQVYVRRSTPRRVGYDGVTGTYSHLDND
ncbi:hypothetical protein HN358_01165 [Candidatus Uhrbacteria bacterium]|nr:hypothetical protein [Candidatus Uhrbacteria bacterium]MBT7717358.1 hypothetical protein [Candidatus Uhrbacteria bacterium]